jgi:hypothetical protein
VSRCFQRSTSDQGLGIRRTIIDWLYNLQRQLAHGPARPAQVPDDAYDQIVLLELVAAIVHGEIPSDRSRTKTKESSGLLVDDALASD